MTELCKGYGALKAGVVGELLTPGPSTPSLKYRIITLMTFHSVEAYDNYSLSQLYVFVATIIKEIMKWFIAENQHSNSKIYI